MTEHTPTALIVDDDPVQVRLLSDILATEGYAVRSSTEADQGLQLAMDIHPDIILLDVMMPVINGYNFCRLLKDQEHKESIPIIMITSRDDLEDIEIGLQMGANAYITKPINTQEFLKTLKVVQSGGATSSS